MLISVAEAGAINILACVNALILVCDRCVCLRQMDDKNVNLKI